tara:strand:+ start:30 stop:662 length:633 start_codon:yes stop_codon:yes gene_type:complete
MTTASATTRVRLLEAAGEIFASEGFDGATVRSICARADANVAAVHYHFGDKESLYREVVDYAFAQLHERFPRPALPPAGGLEHQLRSHVEALLARLFKASASWHGRLLAREMANPGPALPQVAERYMRPQVEALEELLGAVRPDLDLPARRLHALSLIAQCVFFRHARPVLDVLYGPSAFGADELPRLSAHIVETFLTGLAIAPARLESP